MEECIFVMPKDRKTYQVGRMSQSYQVRIFKLEIIKCSVQVDYAPQRGWHTGRIYVNYKV